MTDWAMERLSPRPWREMGFSLVELIVAILMMTGGMLAAAGLVAGVGKTQRRATVRTEMTEVGQSKLEELRAYARMASADTVQLLIGGSLVMSVANHADTVTGGRSRLFVRRWEVVQGPSDTRALTIRVMPLNAALDDVSSIDFHTLLLIM